MSGLTESPSFCMAPWAHVQVRGDGQVYPCCKSMTRLGSVRETPLAGLSDSPELRAMRQDMLAGKPVEGCRKCYDVEGAGAMSMRQRLNRDFQRDLPRAMATAPDGAADFKLRYLEVQFSNVCNFRCRICGPANSTSWHADARALFGPSDAPRLVRPMDDPAALLAQLEPLLEDVERINFFGGEPLIMEETYAILRMLEARKLFRVHLSYSTNFSITELEGRDIFEIWDRFENVHVYASLDGSGRRGEYLRTGQSWDQTLRNRERMLKACPRVEFGVSPTVCAMNARHLPELHREWLERGYLGRDSFHPNFLFEPTYYRAQVLPRELKEEIAARYEAHLGWLRGFSPAAGLAAGFGDDQAAFRSIVNFMNAEDRSGELDQFVSMTRKLDELRGEDFSSVFPELGRLFDARPA